MNFTSFADYITLRLRQFLSRRRSSRKADKPIYQSGGRAHCIYLDKKFCFNTGLFEQTNEVFLLEMFIGGKRFNDLTLAHNYEADGIAKRIIFVRAFFDKLDGLPVQIFVNPNNFNFCRF